MNPSSPVGTAVNAVIRPHASSNINDIWKEEPNIDGITTTTTTPTTDKHTEDGNDDNTTKEMSNKQLHHEVRALLESADLTTITVRSLLQTLTNAHPGVDFEAKRLFIRSLLEKFAAEKVEELKKLKEKTAWKKEISDIREDIVLKNSDKKMKYAQDSDEDSSDAGDSDNSDSDDGDNNEDKKKRKWKADMKASGDARNSGELYNCIVI
jgi:hypothetical protein